jgi:membrane fusion protein, copper/silver efflux system
MNRASDKIIAVPDRFTDQLTNFVNQYFELKNSLVKSDFQLSKSTANKLEASLNNIDMKLVEGEAHNSWMEYYQAMKNQIGLFLKANDIENQREVFSSLSNQLIEAAEVFRLNFEIVYVAYCPMAFNDKGAFWLSEFEEIRNPYFGDDMLECGEVKKRIRNNGKSESKPQQSQVHQH